MAGRDKIDIVAALLLEMDHDGGQVPGRDLFPFAAVADVPVLAENAKKIAVGEKNSPRAVAPHQGVFLAEVGAVGGHHRLIPGAANPQFAVMPVHPAIVRTEGALI